MRKLTDSKSHKSFNIRYSYKEEEKFDINSSEENLKTGKIIYIKISNEKLIENKEMKKIALKYGKIIRIFRKSEGRSYYIEFEDEVFNIFIILVFKSFNNKRFQ